MVVWEVREITSGERGSQSAASGRTREREEGWREREREERKREFMRTSVSAR